MPAKKLKEFLDSHKVRYVSITHSSAYTAQEIAGLAHVPGKELAKTVMVKIAGKMAMAVLPASYRIDFDLLKAVVGSDDIELATEEEFAKMFPDCDVGAMPPFGNLYGMDVFVAESLTERKEIAFNACTHTELIKLAFEDYERLVKPKVLQFSHRE